jgi:hypothetical protein
MTSRRRNDDERFRTCGADGQIIRSTTAQDIIDSGRTVATQRGGTAGTPPVQPAVQRNISFGERVIYFNNSGIIMGPQRRSNEMTGEGRSGFPSDTIDIVVGFNDGGEPCNGQIVNVNAVTDAARMYVSRAVKVDTMFGVARKDTEPEESPLSSVVMKADTARVIGRKGVKIVTGRAQGVEGGGMAGERNAGGGRYEQSATIDLIAGNNTGSESLPFPEIMIPFSRIFLPNWETNYKTLQPAVMGDNLRICLKTMLDIIQDIVSAQQTVTMAVELVFTTLGVGLTAIPGGQPLGIPCQTVGGILGHYGRDGNWSIGQQLLTFENNFLVNEAQRFICSENVNLT